MQPQKRINFFMSHPTLYLLPSSFNLCRHRACHPANEPFIVTSPTRIADHHDRTILWIVTEETPITPQPMWLVPPNPRS